MKIIRFFIWLLLFVLLTIITQIGGIALLICTSIFFLFPEIFKKNWIKIGAFLSVYLLLSALVVPFVAPFFGRMPLPVFSNSAIRPVNSWYGLLNRHYVTTELKFAVERVASQLQQKYPDAKLVYLDANFPFWKNFPLLPHRSHDDGEKLDLAFFYQKAGKPCNQKPSFTGYGVFEAPKKTELNQTALCKGRGYWQYDINQYMAWFVKKELILDEHRTRELIRLLANDPSIRRMFLEPHLKKRFRFQNFAKIRFHGCRAARHDDHIHIEL